MKKIIYFFVGIIIIFNISGCSGKIEPYKVNLNSKYKKIDEEDKEKILKLRVFTLYPQKYNNGDIYIKNTCILSKKSYSKGICYRLVYNNLINYTNTRNNFFPEDYIEFVNSFPKKYHLKENLEKELDGFLIYKDKCEHLKKQTQSKITAKIQKTINQINKSKQKLYPNIKDPNNILTKNEINNISYTKEIKNRIKLYHNYFNKYLQNDCIINYVNYIDFNKYRLNINNIYKDIYIKLRLNEKEKRFKFKYNINPYICSKECKNPIIEIKKIYFNYLPNKFIIKDKNLLINIQTKNIHQNKKSIYGYSNKIKISNNTTHFIIINAIAGYYNNKVIENLLNENIIIPPKSYKLIENNWDLINFPNKKYILVKNRNQKVNYGFSIAYKIQQLNILNNIYFTKDYTIDDFEKNPSL